jgi:hypothetical protein
MADGAPQFRTAEYVGSARNHCGFCHQPVLLTYYRINEAMACSDCADKARDELAKDNLAAYMGAVLYGIGAAIMGMILYATLVIETKIVIGYIASLAVGWLVGKAILTGSNGVAGRRYQITAALLTYAAVSMAAIPITIYDSAQQWRAQVQGQQLEDKQEKEKGVGSRPQPVVPSPTPGQPAPEMSRGETFARLAFIGLVSPFLDLWDNFYGGSIDLIILSAGMGVAANITRGKTIVIYGPFQNTPRPDRC